MALEKQTAFDGVSLAVEWPDPPKATQVAGQPVIAEVDFNTWLREFSLAMQATLDAAAREIEKLKSTTK